MKRLVIAALVTLAACTATTPPPPSGPPTVEIHIGGQVVDRQLREVVVLFANFGTKPLQDIRVAVELPSELANINEMHEPAAHLEQRMATGSNVRYEYAIRRLPAGSTVTVRFPFRREHLGVLSRSAIRATAWSPAYPAGLVEATHGKVISE